MKILVVDDNEDSAETTGMLLELMGHEAMRAHDGGRAIDTALQWLPDLVLLDINLPVFSGHEVAQRLRTEATMRDAYIVALSGYTSDEDRCKSLEAGCDQHIGKPFDTGMLAVMLDDAEKALATRRH
ncbi:MAG: response regulator [Betaproteobacteria bacterium]